MKFPAYVPAAVRELLTHYLDGERGGDIPGYVGLAARADAECKEIERAIEARVSRGEAEYLSGLRRQLTEAQARHKRLSSDVDCLRRFASDARMRDAYALLAQEFTDDEQWRGFILAGWAALIDYGPYREKLKQAGELKAEIGEVAAKLAALLLKFADTGIVAPDEFFSVAALLRNTDNYEMSGHNLHMWRLMRGRLLGDRPDREGNAGPLSVPMEGQGISVLIAPVAPGGDAKISPEERQRDELTYLWTLAPGLPSILQTVADAARNFTPLESGMIGAAIAGRQRNVKTEYIRAFAKMLDRNRVTVTGNAMKAMAIVASVAINTPDVDVSYDDVRKALERLGGDPLENSRAT